MNGMELRPYRPSDLEILCKIDCECFPPGISYSRDQMAEYIAGRNARTWVAEDRDETIGFLIADRAGRESHIITVDVVKAWRRRGVATVLMNAAEEWARREGARLVSLETAEDNIDAQQFYRARGYAKIRTVEGYYSNGAAAWIMVKELGDESTAQGRKLKEKTSGL